MKDDLIIGIGASNEPDSVKAGAVAAKEAIRPFDQCRADIAIVLASSRFRHQDLLMGIASVTGDIPMVGGTTAGEISPGGLGHQSVVICLMGSDCLAFHVASVRRMKDDEKACGIRLAGKLEQSLQAAESRSLILFPDGMGGDGVALLDGIQSVLGSGIEIVGGFLGDDGRFAETFQFFNGRCYRGDMVTGLLVSGNGSFVTSTGVRSGFESIGATIVCTRARKNVVEEFEDQPALALYKELLGEERSLRLPGICLEYPFGLLDTKATIDGNEYFQLRCGLAVNEKDNTITLAGAIPEGSEITLTTASRGEIINGARQAALQARDGLKGAVPRLVLMFSCIGRKLVLGRRTPEEIETVKEIIGADVPVIGFYTYGEIGPIDKNRTELQAARFHNETVVLWVLGQVK